ncbi:MAG: hypothetical protein V4632_06015 [Pseudomonadota bacterium]
MKEKQKSKQASQIITFYSYKGGVGRTMAVANVAFLAAQNGLRVLVMDWDLEAPGLAYYFRGLLDSSSKNLKEARGVLNVMWEWTSSLNSATEENQFKELQERFASGAPFKECARPLLPDAITLEGSALDFIGAGSQVINCPDPRSYEDALAHLSWPGFFDDNAGGFVLSSLRAWAKSNYDLILIDSRTGLADVAGICTMQIPDKVALCFILNRQNIDGVAHVAGAVRAKRQDQVKLHAIPMRVSRSDTPEESDAKARAILDLTKIGGFSSEFAQSDFKDLEVLAADNVPFYEILAPFTAQNPKLDPLTNNYARLTEKLAGIDIKIPDIAPELIEMVRRRLHPRHATTDYVKSLEIAEPSRAVSELERLIESAFESVAGDDELDRDYLIALIDAGLIIDEISDDPDEAIHLKNRVLDLLRMLATKNAEAWQSVFINGIERYLDYSMFRIAGEDEIAILEELDSLLAKSVTVSTWLRRIRYRRQAASVFLRLKNTEATMQTVGEFMSLVSDLLRGSTANLAELSEGQIDELNAAEVDSSFLSGEVQLQKKNLVKADEFYKLGLQRLKAKDIDLSRHESAKTELARLGFYLHLRIATETFDPKNPEAAALHAIAATKLGSGLSASVLNFTQLASAILRVPKDYKYTVTFCQIILRAQERRGLTRIESYYGRQIKLATEFISAISGLSKILVSHRNEEVDEIVLHLTAMSNSVIRNLTRRKSTMGSKQLDDLITHGTELVDVLENFGFPLEQFSELSKLQAKSKLFDAHSESPTDTE